MNYIEHLNQAFRKIHEDTKLRPTHISLYMALFQFANASRFKTEFQAGREELMQYSKIGSTKTYYKCLNELQKWNYIRYYPSKNVYQSSRFSLSNFYPKAKQAINKQGTSGKHVLPPYINIYKLYKDYKSYKQLKLNFKNEVIHFFKKEDQSSKLNLMMEAEKFIAYYEKLNWNIAGVKPITNWQPLAKKWLTSAKGFQRFNQKGIDNNHQLNQNKMYNEPL